MRVKCQSWNLWGEPIKGDRDKASTPTISCRPSILAWHKWISLSYLEFSVFWRELLHFSHTQRYAEILCLKMEIRITQRTSWLQGFSIFYKLIVCIFKLDCLAFGHKQILKTGCLKVSHGFPFSPIESQVLTLCFHPLPTRCNSEGAVIASNHFITTGKAFCPCYQDKCVLR